MPRKAQKAPVAAAAPYTLQTLAVKAIRALDDIQLRSHLSDRVIEEYATLYSEADGDDVLPPIHVFAIARKYYVSDGFHRLEAAKRAKRKELACHVYAGSQQDAMRHGVFANLRRGLSYDQQERQRILEWLLQDPEGSQRSDRGLARDLGLSHVTVGRARQRLATIATLEEEWRAVPVTQTREDLRRQEQIGTFLKVEPSLIASYETMRREPVQTDRILPWVARRMTDSNESVEAAKAAVGHFFHKEVDNHEHARVIRRKYRTPRPPKETPEEQATRQAEEERRSRENSLFNELTRFVALLEGRESTLWREGYTFTDMVAALSPERRQQMPALLTQAEAVIQALKDALAGSVARA